MDHDFDARLMADRGHAQGGGGRERPAQTRLAELEARAQSEDNPQRQAAGSACRG